MIIVPQAAPTLVLGGPGTGKTSSLLESVVAQVEAGVNLQRILVIAGSRPAAQQLRAGIVSALGATQLRPQVMTVHGLAQNLLSLVGSPGVEAPRLLTAPEQELRLRTILAGGNQLRWPLELLSLIHI